MAFAHRVEAPDNLWTLKLTLSGADGR